MTAGHKGSAKDGDAVVQSGVAGTPETSYCPDAGLMAQFVEGALPESDRRAVIGHLDQCQSCRALASDLARANTGLGEALPFTDAPAESMSSVGAGDQVGRFALGELLGAGSMGVVYSARDGSLRRDVAVKLLRETRPDIQLIMRERLLREARALARLSHPSIVPVYELGESNGSPYYAMKRVDGTTLAARLASCASLADRLQLLPQFLSACQGVAYAHRHAIVHRDLKPLNIMVGDFGETYVVDWGLAKTLAGEDADEVATVETQDGARSATPLATVAGRKLGTPAYMSPEQAEGRILDVDERSDVYGLGVILYEILAGPSPDAQPPSQALTRPGPVRAVAERCPRAPRELVAICERCLAPNPQDRYPNAGALAHDLEAFVSGRRVAAYTYSLWELLARLAKRYQVALVAACAMLVLLLATGVVAYVRVRVERNEAAKAFAQARSRYAELLHQEAGRSIAAGEASLAVGKLRTSLELDDSLAGRALFHTAVQSRRLLKHRLPEASRLIQFTPDGEAVLAAALEGPIYKVDVETGRETAMRGHHGYVSSLAVSAKTHLAVSGGNNGEIRLWDLTQGTLLRIYEGHSGMVRGLAFGVDGSWFISGSYDGTVRLWDRATGAAEILHKAGPIGVTLATEDGKTAVFAGAGGLRVMRLPSREVACRMSVVQMSTAQLSPDGHLLAMAYWTSGPSKIRLVDSATCTEVGRLEGHSDTVLALAFSRDGRQLVSGSADKSARLWDLAERRTIATFPAHDDAVWAVAISPDGSRIATATGSDLYLYRAAEAEYALERGHAGAAWEVAASPEGNAFATGGEDGSIRLWDARTGEQSAVFPGYGRGIRSLRFSRDGTRLAYCDEARVIRVLDRSTLALVQQFQDLNLSTVARLEFSADGGSLFSTSDTCVRMWDLSTGELERKIGSYRDAVLGVAASPDGRFLAASGVEGVLKIWDLATGRLVKKITGPVAGLAYSSDGRWLTGAAVRNDAVWLIDTTVWSEEKIATRLPSLASVDMSSDGHELAAAGADGTLWLRDGSGRERWLRPLQTGAFAASLSPDGRLIATGGGDGALRALDFATGGSLWRGPLLWHDPKGGGVEQFSHRGRTVRTEQGDKTLEPELTWHEAVLRSSRAETLAESRFLCLADDYHGFEMWNRETDELVMRSDSDPQALLALPEGCAGIVEGDATFWGENGAKRTLCTEATALGLDLGGLLAVCSGELVAFSDADLVPVEHFAADDDVISVFGDREWIATGYRNGTVEIIERRIPEIRQVLPGAEAQNAAAVRFAKFGELGLLVGYGSGAVLLWDLASQHSAKVAKLHGPISHLLVQKGRLHALTAVGDAGSWDLRYLLLPYCSFMQTLWQSTRASWVRDHLERTEQPESHPCARKVMSL